MKVITLADKNNFASNCYILVFEDSFSVIDPSVSYERAKMEIPEISKLRAQYVLLTHGHVDHFWHIQSYIDAGCEVLVTEHDGLIAKDKTKNCALILNGILYDYLGSYKAVADGDTIQVGDTEFTVISTPGHTAGSVCYLSDRIMFTGDTLFARGSYGRYDLPSGSKTMLFDSLEKLFALDGDIMIYPGHGEKSTLRDTKMFFI